MISFIHHSLLLITLIVAALYAWSMSGYSGQVLSGIRVLAPKYASWLIGLGLLLALGYLSPKNGVLGLTGPLGSLMIISGAFFAKPRDLADSRDASS